MRQKLREHNELSLTKVMCRMRAMVRDMHERIDVQSHASIVNRDTIIDCHLERTCMDSHVAEISKTLNSTDFNEYNL